MDTELDLITIGRVSVDLYGQQIGTRLEDVSTFVKAVGGCPANIAIGAARLGLKAALISLVGNEAMGRFVTEQLAREGVETRAVRTHPQRLTSLVLLSVRDQESFPLIFYRENCADSALCEDDIDEAFVACARAVLVTGTHFSIPEAAKAQRKAIAIARANGRKVVLDIDYRPNLWGIGGHDSGESRYAPSAEVTRVLSSVLPCCDLIVGTEEELHIAAGTQETLDAIRRIRALSDAVIVCKRGPQGCVVFEGRIPDRLEQGLVAAASAVSVYNVLGAGDAFLAGFLRGYLRGEGHEMSASFANACGAIAVSRLLCSAEFPTLTELHHYLANGSPHRALRQDEWLNHLHWVTTRQSGPTGLFVLAIDQRARLEARAEHTPAPTRRLSQFNLLAVQAAERVAAGRDGFGILLEGSPAAAEVEGAAPGLEPAAPVLRGAATRTLWLARSVELTDSRPLEFHLGPSVATQLNEWPVNVTAKCRCFYHPDDAVALRVAQERELLRLVAACRAQRRELLLEIIVAGDGELPSEDTVARALSRLYEKKVRADWWLLRPQPSTAAWNACANVIARQDPYCRGVLLSGLADSLDDLSRSLQLAAAHRVVRGFVVGRTIFAGMAQAWLSGRTSDEDATEQMAERIRAVVDSWSSASDPRSDRPAGSLV
ncbi:MAG: 5-dehydro-2-deoxygluconokinase [Sinobacteraceae bacterium]|nr:5-dehydro-2-deoxygluconokinase [Nevskiaceae bacterium]